MISAEELLLMGNNRPDDQPSPQKPRGLDTPGSEPLRDPFSGIKSLSWCERMIPLSRSFACAAEPAAVPSFRLPEQSCAVFLDGAAWLQMVRSQNSGPPLPQDPAEQQRPLRVGGRSLEAPEPRSPANRKTHRLQFLAHRRKISVCSWFFSGLGARRLKREK